MTVVVKNPRWADRDYRPIEAAYAVMQFLEIDPDFFLKQFAAAGVTPVVRGTIIEFDANGRPVDLARLDFLRILLGMSGVGKAFRTSLRRRGLVDRTTGALSDGSPNSGPIAGKSGNEAADATA